MADLEDAILLAVTEHRGQKDKGGAAYILHPLRLMARMNSDVERMGSAASERASREGRGTVSALPAGLAPARARRRGRRRVTSAGDAEAYETLGGTVLVFLGLQGSGGVLRSARGAWEFLPEGSVAWDGYHQEIYRNFRGERLDGDALAARGLELPPLDQYRNRPGVAWKDNFPSGMPLAEVPVGPRSPLSPGTFTVFLVMMEDGYETSFGDGKFLYAERAYRDRAQAERFLDERRREAEDPTTAPDPAKAEWYRYTLKEIRVTVGAERVDVELALESFEHVSVDDVLRLLADG